MIETSMIFGLGFLTATLVALLIVPALSARAERLTRRRIEALFPLSIEELTAEKDHLRAEFAVLQRRIELKAEAAQAARQSAMGDLGRRIGEVETLTASLAERTTRLAAVEAEFAEAKTAFDHDKAALAGTSAELKTTQDTLSALETVHHGVVVDQAADRLRLEANAADLARLAREIETEQAALAEREAAYARLLEAHTAILQNHAAQKVALAEMEAKLASAATRESGLARALAEHQAELASERQRSEERRRDLAAEQERGAALDVRNRAFLAERDKNAQAVAASAQAVAQAEAARAAARAEVRDSSAETETVRNELATALARIGALDRDAKTQADENAAALRQLEERVEVLKADRASIEGALAAARKERSRSELDLKGRRRGVEAAADAALQAENAALGRRIDELARVILAMGESDDLAAAPSPPRDPVPAARRERRPVRA